LRPESVDVGTDFAFIVVDVRDNAEVYSILERLERLGMNIINFAQQPPPTSEEGVQMRSRVNEARPGCS
jgi:hypothetical protein